MSKTLRKLRGDVRGATAVEYGLLVALLILAIMVALLAVGGRSTATWISIDQAAGGAMREAAP